MARSGASAQNYAMENELPPTAEGASLAITEGHLGTRLRAYVLMLADRHPFTKVIRLDPARLKGQLAEFWPDIPEWHKEAEQIWNYIEDIAHSASPLAPALNIVMRISVARTKMSPHLLPEAQGNAAVATFDGETGMMRSRTLPVSEPVPVLDDMTISAGLMVICQPLPPLVNQFSDSRPDALEVSSGSEELFGGRNRDRVVGGGIKDERYISRISVGFNQPNLYPENAEEQYNETRRKAGVTEGEYRKWRREALEAGALLGAEELIRNGENGTDTTDPNQRSAEDERRRGAINNEERERRENDHERRSPGHERRGPMRDAPADVVNQGSLSSTTPVQDYNIAQLAAIAAATEAELTSTVPIGTGFSTPLRPGAVLSNYAGDVEAAATPDEARATGRALELAAIAAIENQSLENQAAITQAIDAGQAQNDRNLAASPEGPGGSPSVLSEEALAAQGTVAQVTVAQVTAAQGTASPGVLSEESLAAQGAVSQAAASQATPAQGVVSPSQVTTGTQGNPETFGNAVGAASAAGTDTTLVEEVLPEAIESEERPAAAVAEPRSAVSERTLDQRNGRGDQNIQGGRLAEGATVETGFRADNQGPQTTYNEALHSGEKEPVAREPQSKDALPKDEDPFSSALKDYDPAKASGNDRNQSEPREAGAVRDTGVRGAEVTSERDVLREGGIKDARSPDRTSVPRDQDVHVAYQDVKGAKIENNRSAFAESKPDGFKAAGNVRAEPDTRAQAQPGVHQDVRADNQPSFREVDTQAGSRSDQGRQQTPAVSRDQSAGNLNDGRDVSRNQGPVQNQRTATFDPPHGLTHDSFHETVRDMVKNFNPDSKASLVTKPDLLPPSPSAAGGLGLNEHFLSTTSFTQSAGDSIRRSGLVVANVLTEALAGAAALSGMRFNSALTADQIRANAEAAQQHQLQKKYELKDGERANARQEHAATRSEKALLKEKLEKAKTVAAAAVEDTEPLAENKPHAPHLGFEKLTLDE